MGHLIKSGSCKLENTAFGKDDKTASVLTRLFVPIKSELLSIEIKVCDALGRQWDHNNVDNSVWLLIGAFLDP